MMKKFESPPISRLEREKYETGEMLKYTQEIVPKLIEYSKLLEEAEQNNVSLEGPAALVRIMYSEEDLDRRARPGGAAWVPIDFIAENLNSSISWIKERIAKKQEETK